MFTCIFKLYLFIYFFLYFMLHFLCILLYVTMLCLCKAQYVHYEGNNLDKARPQILLAIYIIC